MTPERQDVGHVTVGQSTEADRPVEARNGLKETEASKRRPRLLNPTGLFTASTLQILAETGLLWELLARHCIIL